MGHFGRGGLTRARRALRLHRLRPPQPTSIHSGSAPRRRREADLARRSRPRRACARSDDEPLQGRSRMAGEGRRAGSWTAFEARPGACAIRSPFSRRSATCASIRAARWEKTSPISAASPSPFARTGTHAEARPRSPSPAVHRGPALLPLPRAGHGCRLRRGRSEGPPRDERPRAALAPRRRRGRQHAGALPGLRLRGAGEALRGLVKVWNVYEAPPRGGIA